MTMRLFLDGFVVRHPTFCPFRNRKQIFRPMGRVISLIWAIEPPNVKISQITRLRLRWRDCRKGKQGKHLYKEQIMLEHGKDDRFKRREAICIDGSGIQRAQSRRTGCINTIDRASFYCSVPYVLSHRRPYSKITSNGYGT